MRNRYPLLITFIAASLIFGVIGAWGRDKMYADYDNGASGEPSVALPFRAAASGVYPWSDYETAEEKAAREAEEQRRIEEERALALKKAQEEAERQAALEEEERQRKEREAEEAAAAAAAEEARLEEERRKAEEGHFSTVSDDYFRDALFIGDSRTVGLSEYCRELNERAIFFAETSMTIYGVLDARIVSEGDSKITVDEALQRYNFGKIYITLGLNEMGGRNEDTFISEYKRVVDRIRELQPDAIIYLQSIMHVTADKDATDAVFNNANINERNTHIKTLAENYGVDVYYIDMNIAVDDASGALLKDLTFDNVHLIGSAYELWHQFLLSHAVVRSDADLEPVPYYKEGIEPEEEEMMEEEELAEDAPEQDDTGNAASSAASSTAASTGAAEQNLPEPSIHPVTGLPYVIDPATGQMYSLDPNTNEIIAVNPDTGRP